MLVVLRLFVLVFFYVVMEWFLMTKNSDVEIPNLVVNHKSCPVKLNPGLCVPLFIGL